MEVAVASLHGGLLLFGIDRRSVRGGMDWCWLAMLLLVVVGFWVWAYGYDPPMGF